MTNQPTILTFEDRELLPGKFRNFSGEEGMYNAAGDRFFNLTLTPEEAEALLADGWNVKQLKPRDEDTEGKFILKVKLQYRNRTGKLVRPPKVVLINGSKDRLHKTEIGEDMINVLDFAQVERIDCSIRPYDWTTVNGSGRTAYLKSLYVTLVPDDFSDKYEDIPMSNNGFNYEPGSF